MKVRRLFNVCLAAVALATPPFAGAQTVSLIETYDSAPPGWILRFGTTSYLSQGGNPGPHVRTTGEPVESMMFEYFNNAYEPFLGDYASNVAMTFGLDLKVDTITAWGAIPIQTDLWVWFVEAGGGWVGVAYQLGTMEGGQDWRTLRITWNPSGASLPDGWVGFGATDPVTHQPILPDGVTFHDVMANVGDVRLTMFKPTHFHVGVGFDLRVDNLTIARHGEFVFTDGFEDMANSAVRGGQP